MSLKAKANDKITCVNGHVVGHFNNEVDATNPITANDLALDFGENGVATPDNESLAGHKCARCKESATIYDSDGSFRVHTVAGWIR